MIGYSVCKTQIDHSALDCSEIFKLNVKERESVEVKSKYGDDVELTCEAEGSPQPVFKWFRDGKQLSSTGILRLKSVTQNATYTCKAEQTTVIGCNQPSGVINLTLTAGE